MLNHGHLEGGLSRRHLSCLLACSRSLSLRERNERERENEREKKKRKRERSRPHPALSFCLSVSLSVAPERKPLPARPVWLSIELRRHCSTFFSPWAVMRERGGKGKFGGRGPGKRRGREYSARKGESEGVRERIGVENRTSRYSRTRDNTE